MIAAVTPDLAWSTNNFPLVLWVFEPLVMQQKRDRRKSGDKFREMSQRGYDRLIDVLRTDRVEDLVEQLTNFSCVEDLMRDVPTLVPVLLELAWNARQSDHLSEYFMGAESGVLSENRGEPLAPCGRSFNAVVNGHLIGAARLYFNGLEKCWAREESKKRADEYQAGRAKKRYNPFGLIADACKTLFNKHPAFPPSDLRSEYYGHALYPALKPFLLDPGQFQLIPYYALFNARQVKAIGPLLRGMHTPEGLSAAAAYDARQLKELCGCALTFARTVLSFSDTSELYALPQKPNSILNEGAERDEVLAGEMLSSMVAEHRSSIPDLLNNLEYAEPVIKSCAASEGHAVWTLFSDSMALDNIALCPEEIVHGIGALAGAVSPVVSRALEGFDNLTIPRDFLLYAKSQLGEPMVRGWVSDDTCLPAWKSMSVKFNKEFSYNRDSKASTCKNFSDLKDVSVELFQSFRDIGGGGDVGEMKRAA